MVRYLLQLFAVLMSLHTIFCILAWLALSIMVLMVGFGYDVSVMISWLFGCPQQLRVLIVGFGYVSVVNSWLFSCPKQLSLKIIFIE